MGYTIKQKIEICLKSESNPEMTQADLAKWAQDKYESTKPPSQTTISRILSSKNDIIGAKETDFKLIRRRKQSNPLLRKILTEWITQAIWENIPITTPIIQSTANAIWNRLPKDEKDGNGIFNQKWCHHFMKKLNINLIGDPHHSLSTAQQPSYKLNKVWRLDEKIELKNYLVNLIREDNYSPQDIFVIDEFQLFYSLPLDQIFDVSSIDKGLKQSNSSTEKSLTIMLGCNIDGSEKLIPLIVGKYDKFDVSKSNHMAFKNHSSANLSQHTLMNKITEVHQIYYKSNINKWITSSMFQNYLLTLDHKIEQLSPHRKILILLDDSSSHRIINLKFNNIKLCYLKNNINHKNPSNSVFNGVGGLGGLSGGLGGGSSSGGAGGGRFDYLPMNFGIIDEFRILYRLQQYLEMINLQRINSKKDANNSNNNNNSNDSRSESNNNRNSNLDLSSYNKINASSAMEVLSEKDYHIPLIKVIEWIKRSWDSISSEKIYLSWRRTFLLPLSHSSIAWPATNPEISNHGQQIVAAMLTKSSNYDPSKSYNKLAEIMGYLNVVIPWEIDELLGLVNEMGKVTLSYVSIEEIIGSCLSENYDSSEDEDNNPSAVANNDVSSLVNDDQWYQPSANDNVNPFGNNKLYEDSPSSLLETISVNKPQQLQQIQQQQQHQQQQQQPQIQPPPQQPQSQPTPLDLAYADFAASPSGSITANSNANRALNTLIGVTEREASSLVDANTAINLLDTNKDVATTTNAVDIPTPGSKFAMSPSLPSPTTTNLLNSVTQSGKHKIEDTASINWLNDKRRPPTIGSYANTSYSIVSGTPSPMLGNNMPLNTAQASLVVPELSQSYMSSSVKHNYPTIQQFRQSPVRGYSDLATVSASSSTISTSTVSNMPKNMNDFEAMKVLKNLLTLSSMSESVKLSPATINELNMNLKELQSRIDLNTGNQQSPPS